LGTGGCDGQIVRYAGGRHVTKAVSRLRSRGQNVVEYGALIATIVLVVLLATTAFGKQVQPWLSWLAVRVTTAVT